MWCIIGDGYSFFGGEVVYYISVICLPTNISTNNYEMRSCEGSLCWHNVVAVLLLGKELASHTYVPLYC